MYQGEEAAYHAAQQGNEAESMADANDRAEMEYQQSLIPTRAIEVLELFQPTKVGVISFASKVINDVADGKVNALRVKLLCKTLEEVADKINEGTKEYQANEGAKYGDKPFMFHGAEMHHTATYTKYIYSNCNDAYLNDLEAQAKELQEKIESRQKQLRAIVNPMPMGHPETGEVYTCNPPGKKQTIGIKTTLK